MCPDSTGAPQVVATIRARGRSAEEIVASTQALRDEWDRDQAADAIRGKGAPPRDQLVRVVPRSPTWAISEPCFCKAYQPKWR